MQKITVIGNLGKKPEERVVGSGTKVVSFSIAARVKKDVTQWYDITIWEEKIPVFMKMLGYLDKGSRVCVIGDLGLAESYQKRDGSIGVKLKIYPDSINFVGSTEKSTEKTETIETREKIYVSKGESHFGPNPGEEELPF